MLQNASHHLMSKIFIFPSPAWIHLELTPKVLPAYLHHLEENLQNLNWYLQMAWIFQVDQSNTKRYHWAWSTVTRHFKQGSKGARMKTCSSSAGTNQSMLSVHQALVGLHGKDTFKANFSLSSWKSSKSYARSQHAWHCRTQWIGSPISTQHFMCKFRN